MKIYFGIFLLFISFFPALAQNPELDGMGKAPKFIPKNQADGYVLLEIKKDKNQVLLRWEVEKEGRGYTYHLLKGIRTENQSIRWEVLGEFLDPEAKTKVYTFIDGNPQLGEILYRLRVTDENYQVFYSRFYFLNESLKGKVQEVF
jgi:hypothetical protein